MLDGNQLMFEEGIQFDKKSLLIFSGDPGRWNWSKIAKHCVAMANASGGRLCFGIEDREGLPSAEQRIPHKLADRLQKGVSHHCFNVATAAKIERCSNGGEVLFLDVFPCRQTIASTTDGRYFLRIADESRPLLPEDLPRLVAEKDAYTWELQTTLRLPESQSDPAKTHALLADLRRSQRVSEFVRQKEDRDLLEHFSLLRDGLLTNLGILWIGLQSDRTRLLYPPAIQFIKYDQQEQKVFKRIWTDASLNPKELIEAVWTEIPDWQEYIELPDGLLRQTLPHYDEVVIRELLANALVHRPYTTRGDIFLNLYPDRLEIHNPGLLPLGVTPKNILHQSVARNRHLSELFYALGLMEREGSGYDRLYEVLLSQARPIPIVREEHDRVIVTVERRIIKPEVIDLLAKIDERYQLRQRERISLGLLAQHGTLTAIEFSRILAVDEDSRLRLWLGRLIGEEIVLSRGKTRATEYRINPQILRAAAFKGKTTLKGIAPHRLRQLILEDLAVHGPDPSKPVARGDLHRRIGAEIPVFKLRAALEDLTTQGRITSTGKRGKGGGYFIERKPVE
jgi:ATP-dependent DNA helicase RecG